MPSEPDDGAANSNATSVQNAFAIIASEYNTDADKVQQIVEERFGVPHDDTRDAPGELKAAPEQKSTDGQRLADVILDEEAGR